MNRQPLLRMEIQNILIDPGTNMPVVILSIPERDSVFPLWIGIYEANGIMLELEGIVVPRPMTHDLFKNTVQAMGGTVTRVCITDFREGTDFATVFVQHRGEELAIDARPSDAFSLAVRFKAPIYLDSTILAKYQTFDDADSWLEWATSNTRGDAG